MISILTMERPAMTPMAAPVGAALAALPPTRSSVPSASSILAGLPGVYTLAKRGGFAGFPSTVCHDWTIRNRQVDTATRRSSRHLRSPRT